MFTGVQHLIHDIGLVFSYIAQSLSTLFGFIVTPFTAAAEFVRGFFSVAFSDPTTEIANLNITSGSIEIVEELPYFESFQKIVGLSIVFLIGIAIFKTFQKL